MDLVDIYNMTKHMPPIRRGKFCGYAVHWGKLNGMCFAPFSSFQTKTNIMETLEEINNKITAITTQIRTKYPELYEHLGEMPVTNPDEEHPSIAEKLKEYYNTLNSMMVKYAHEHPTFDI